MSYKYIIRSNDYLCHFNPNHDPKTGQFTFTKFVKNGRLTDTGKEIYGLNDLDNDRVSVRNKKDAQRQIDKELGKIWNKNKNFSNLLSKTIKETPEMASRRFNKDLEDANNNEEFISDLKSEVKRFVDTVNNEHRDGFDVIDKTIATLSKKYPQYSELIQGYAPYQYFDKYDENEWAEYNSSKYREETGSYKISKGLGKSETKTYTYTRGPLTDVLNYDHYYEPKEIKVSEAQADDLVNAINRELTSHLIQKYGKYNIPSSWLKYT